MYLGQVKQTIPYHRDTWIEGIGTIAVQAGTMERILESYRCDACGRVVNVLGRAEEPFYCRCQQEIAID